MTILHVEKASGQMQYPFTTKALNKFGAEGASYNITKARYGKSKTNILNVEKLEGFPLRSGTRR